MLELVSIGGAEPVGGIQLASFFFNLVFHLFSKCWRAVTGGYLGSGPASGENITCFSRCGQQSPTSPPDHPDEQRRQSTGEPTVVETPVLERPLGDELPGTWSWWWWWWWWWCVITHLPEVRFSSRSPTLIRIAPVIGSAESQSPVTDFASSPPRLSWVESVCGWVSTSTSQNRRNLCSLSTFQFLLGWQKLASFRQAQKCLQFFRRTHIC